MSRKTPVRMLPNSPKANLGQTISGLSARRFAISAASGYAFEPDEGQMLPVGLECCQHEFEFGAARPVNSFLNDTRTRQAPSPRVPFKQEGPETPSGAGSFKPSGRHTRSLAQLARQRRSGVLVIFPVDLDGFGL